MLLLTGSAVNAASQLGNSFRMTIHYEDEETKDFAEDSQ